jgi:hypothetical protein
MINIQLIIISLPKSDVLRFLVFGFPAFPPLNKKENKILNNAIQSDDSSGFSPPAYSDENTNGNQNSENNQATIPFAFLTGG